jgi:copper chaperone CopZ
MDEMKIKVGGMNCNHCKINVETGLKRVSGIDYAVADIINGEVKLKGSLLDPNKIKTAVEDLGYFYDGIIQ